MSEPPKSSLKLTSDPRAERTRQQIFEALRSLLSDRSASVSVGDIVRVAGISRSSFYAHFASLDELAAELLRSEFVAITDASVDASTDGESSVGRHAARVGYARLVGHMVENLALYANVLELPLTRSVYDRVVESYAEQFLTAALASSAPVSEAYSTPASDSAPATDSPLGTDSAPATDSFSAAVPSDLVVRYVAGGALALISSWVRGQLDVSDDELVDGLVDLLPPWLPDGMPEPDRAT